MRDLKKEVVTIEEYDGDGNLVKKTVRTEEREYMPPDDDSRLKWGYEEPLYGTGQTNEG